MSARQEAIEAVERASILAEDWRELVEQVVDAIPADVLARLAIERGSLIQEAWRFESTGHRGHGYMTYFEGEAGHADHVRLYRVVGP
jgi:hypothetical protein